MNDNFLIRIFVLNFVVAETEDYADQKSDNLVQHYQEGETNQVFLDETMLPFLEFIDENVIGGKTRFEGPYGERRGMTKVNIHRYHSSARLVNIFIISCSGNRYL